MKISVILVFSCNTNTFDIAGNVTQTGNGTTLTVAGLLYEQDGNIPAPDARVTIHQLTAANQTSSGIALKKSASGMETVFTDAQGKFVFNSLQSRGPYMIEADQGETLFVMIEYVAINENDSVVNVEDTLKAPGSIKAVVCFDYPDMRVEKATFTLYAYYKSDPNDQRSSSGWYSKGYGDEWIENANNCNGDITIDNLAEGLYTISIDIGFPIDFKVKGGSFHLKRPVIFIKSGQVTDLGTLRFPEMDIPDVEQCWGWPEYDSSTGSIRIGWKWNISDTDKVSGVNIYQQSISKLPLKINAVPVRDTVFVDTGFWDFPRRPEIYDFWWDSTPGVRNPFDTISHGNYVIQVLSICPNYFLMSVDKNGKES
jgi:hypothetical protein